MELPPGSIIASGPVIIEDGKVLLNREQKLDGITPWMFPGGEVEDFDASLEDACKREAKEEAGIDVEIIKPLRPIMIEYKGKVIVLIHWLASRTGDVTAGEGIVDIAWHDITALPENCTPNVFQIIDDLKAKL